MRAMRPRRRRRSPERPDVLAEPVPPERRGRSFAPLRELAGRINDGLHVVLLWDPRDDAVAVAVADARTGHGICFPVEPSRAMDAFHHPFTYAP